MNLSAQEIARLHALPLFAGLSADSLRDLLGDCAVRMHGKRKTLFLQGDPATHFFVVLSGWVKLFRLRPDGAEVVVEIFGPGESFAEGAMHMPEGYPVSAEMVEDGRLLAVPTAAFGERVRQDPNLAISMLASMAVRLKELVNRIEKKETQTAAQRVADFLLKFGGPAPRT
ncbi:MAG: Crp/Fnr family transcriptional regulator, partial [Rhodospirillaceae bacterium]|nr:Crp/Fnr family transcriptional regulator [Rhodospirillaceae bacterium]